MNEELLELFSIKLYDSKEKKDLEDLIESYLLSDEEIEISDELKMSVSSTSTIDIEIRVFENGKEVNTVEKTLLSATPEEQQKKSDFFSIDEQFEVKEHLKEQNVSEELFSQKKSPFFLEQIERFHILENSYNSVIMGLNEAHLDPEIIKYFRECYQEILTLRPLIHSIEVNKKWYDRLRYLISPMSVNPKDELNKWIHPDSKCPEVIKSYLTKYFDYLLTYRDFQYLPHSSWIIEQKNWKIQKTITTDTRKCSPGLDLKGEIISYSHVSNLYAQYDHYELSEAEIPIFLDYFRAIKKDLSDKRWKRSKRLKKSRMLSDKKRRDEYFNYLKITAKFL